MKDKIEKIEDIYPLTIISPKYKDVFVIFNRNSDSKQIHDVELSEEISYQLDEWLDENISPNCYGIGKTIWDAFEDYKKRYYGYK